MAHHAYVTEGSAEEVIQKSKHFAHDSLGLSDTSPDFISYSFGQLSVEDARRVTGIAQQSGTGSIKVVVLHANRLFHQAQNALLKIFEEPPAGVVIILGVPTTGILLPTLRSRLLPLPLAQNSEKLPAAQGSAADFLLLSSSEREKYLSKLIDRTKVDNEKIKDAARAEAVRLIQSLTELAHGTLQHTKKPEKRQEIQELLEDLTAFLPLMHERSIPLKLVFEHVQLVIPTDLKRTPV